MRVAALPRCRSVGRSIEGRQTAQFRSRRPSKTDGGVEATDERCLLVFRTCRCRPHQHSTVLMRSLFSWNIFELWRIDNWMFDLRFAFCTSSVWRWNWFDCLMFWIWVWCRPLIESTLYRTISFASDWSISDSSLCQRGYFDFKCDRGGANWRMAGE